MQSSHFVFILDRQQFEVVLGHGLCQFGAPGKLLLQVAHLCQQIGITLCIGSVLVRREELATYFDHLLQ
ncbi:hypothetical protein D3C81_1959510 [compost metagenome]